MDWADAFASGNDQRAELAANLLVQDGHNAVDVCAELVQNPQTDVRWWAVRVLGELGLPECAELLSERLNDVDLSVRQCAALALRQHPHQATIPTLLSLLDHSDTLLARLAADALIAAGKPALTGLLEVLQGQSLQARQQAARCLAKIADPGAIPALFEALDDESAWIRFFADEGLEKMGVGMIFFKP